MVRTDNYGNYRNSAPCKNCFSMISELKIKRIIFSTEDENFQIFKTEDYKTEHISNGNRFLTMTDEEKNTRIKKKKQPIRSFHKSTKPVPDSYKHNL